MGAESLHGNYPYSFFILLRRVHHATNCLFFFPSHHSLPAVRRPLSVNVPVVRQQQAFESFGRWLVRGCHRDRPLGKEGGRDIWMIRIKRFRAAQQQSSNTPTLSSVIKAGNVGRARTLIGHAARRGPCASLSQSNNSFRQDALQMSP